MTNYDYIIVGGGIAGTNAAEAIRSHDPNSSIVIFTEEPDHLYSRVLLPHYLRNENTLESLYIRKLDSYQEKNIELKTEKRIKKVDTGNGIVNTDSGEEYSYKKLLLATGGKVNRLPTTGSDLKGVLYLRTIKDAQKVKEQIGESQEAVVLGGGFIGIEFAQSFVKNNLKTTAVIREKCFWEAVVGENSGKLLSEILTKNGVQIIAQQEVEEFLGNQKIETLKLGNGQTLRADIVGVGIGIHLDLDYLTGSNLATKKGVVTNEFLEASEKNVWAAGDLAEFYDPVVKRYHVLGNWSNASAQGRLVGSNMVIEKKPFETASMYSINIFDVNFSFLGDPTVDEKTEILERGNVESGKIARLLIKDDRIQGASLINLPLERNTLTKLIKEQIKLNIGKEKLADLNFDLNQLLT